MNDEDAGILRALLHDERVLSLGVLIEGAPFAGLLPFALSAGGEALLVHASDLAPHTRGLADGARFAALVHRADTGDADPLQIPRLSVQGEVGVVARGTPEHADGRARYTAKFPDSEPMFDFGDFNLYALRFRRARFVIGFARAVTLSAAGVREALAEAEGA